MIGLWQVRKMGSREIYNTNSAIFTTFFRKSIWTNPLRKSKTVTLWRPSRTIARTRTRLLSTQRIKTIHSTSKIGLKTRYRTLRIEKSCTWMMISLRRQRVAPISALIEWEPAWRYPFIRRIWICSWITRSPWNKTNSKVTITHFTKIS